MRAISGSRRAACYLLNMGTSPVRYYGKGAVIVLGSRAAGIRASRVNAVPFSFCGQTSAPDGATSSMRIDLNADVGEADDAARRRSSWRCSTWSRRSTSPAASMPAIRRHAPTRLGRGVRRAQHRRAPGYRDPGFAAAAPSTCRPSSARTRRRPGGVRWPRLPLRAARGSHTSSRTARCTTRPRGTRAGARRRARRARCRSGPATRGTGRLAVARGRAWPQVCRCRARPSWTAPIGPTEPGAARPAGRGAHGSGAGRTQAVTLAARPALCERSTVTRCRCESDTLCIHGDTPGRGRWRGGARRARGKASAWARRRRASTPYADAAQPLTRHS